MQANTQVFFGSVGRKLPNRAINYQLELELELKLEFLLHPDPNTDPDFDSDLAGDSSMNRNRTGLHFYNFYNNRIQLSNVHQQHVQQQHPEYPHPHPTNPYNFSLCVERVCGVRAAYGHGHGHGQGHASEAHSVQHPINCCVCYHLHRVHGSRSSTSATGEQLPRFLRVMQNINNMNRRHVCNYVLRLLLLVVATATTLLQHPLQQYSIWARTGMDRAKAHGK